MEKELDAKCSRQARDHVRAGEKKVRNRRRPKKPSRRARKVVSERKTEGARGVMRNIKTTRTRKSPGKSDCHRFARAAHDRAQHDAWEPLLKRNHFFGRLCSPDRGNCQRKPVACKWRRCYWSSSYAYMGPSKWLSLIPARVIVPRGSRFLT